MKKIRTITLRMLLVVFTMTASSINAWCFDYSEIFNSKEYYLDAAHYMWMQNAPNDATIMLDSAFVKGLDGEDLGFYYLLKGLTQSQLDQNDSVDFFIDKSWEIYKDMSFDVYAMPLDMMVEYYLLNGNYKKADEILSTVDVPDVANVSYYDGTFYYINNVLFNKWKVKEQLHDSESALAFMFQYFNILNDNPWLLSDLVETDRINLFLSSLANIDSHAFASFTPKNKMTLLFYLGHKAFMDNDYDAATKQLNEVVGIAQKNKFYDNLFIASIYFLDKCYEQTDSKKNASLELLKVKDKDIEQLDSLSRANMFYAKGEVYFKQDKLKEALSYWQRIIDIHYSGKTRFDLQLRDIFNYLSSIEDEKLSVLTDEDQLLVLTSKAVENNRSYDSTLKQKGLNYLRRALVIYLQEETSVQVSPQELKPIDYIVNEALYINFAKDIDDYLVKSESADRDGKLTFLLAVAKSLIKQRRNNDAINYLWWAWCSYHIDQSYKNEFFKDVLLSLIGSLENFDNEVLNKLGYEQFRELYFLLAWKYNNYDDKESIAKCVYWSRKFIELYWQSPSEEFDVFYSLTFSFLNSIDEHNLTTLPADMQITVLAAKGSLLEQPVDFNKMVENVSYLQRALNMLIQGESDTYQEEDEWIISLAANAIPNELYGVFPKKQLRDLLFMKSLLYISHNDYETASKLLLEAIDISSGSVNCFDEVMGESLANLNVCYNHIGYVPNTHLEQLQSKLLDDTILIGTSLKRKLCFLLAHFKEKEMPEKAENSISGDAMTLFKKVVDLSSTSKDFYDDLLISSIAVIYQSQINPYDPANNELALKVLEELMASIDVEEASVSVRSKLRLFKSLIELPRNSMAAIQQLEKARNEYIEGKEHRDEFYVKICNLLGETLMKNGNNEDALACLEQMVVECGDDLFDHFPMDAYQAFTILRELYYKNGDTIMAERISYLNELRYAIKAYHDNRPGKIMKQIVGDYELYISEFQDVKGEEQLGLIVGFGECWYMIRQYKNAIDCYDNCIKKKEHLKSKRDILDAYLGKIQCAVSMQNDSLFNEFYDDAINYVKSRENSKSNELTINAKVGNLFFVNGNGNQDSLSISQDYYKKALKCVDKNTPLLHKLDLDMQYNLIDFYLGNDSALEKINNGVETLEKMLRTLDNEERIDVKGLICSICSNIAEYLTQIGQGTKAIDYLNKASQYSVNDDLHYSVLMLMLEAYSQTDKNDYVKEKKELIRDLEDIEKIFYGSVLPDTENKIKNIKTQ